MFVRYILLIVFIFSYKIFSNEIQYSSKELFPLHEDMVDACNFWIKVFAGYNTNQYIIHDSRNLDVVYEVVTWGELDESKADDPFTKKQKKYFKKKINKYKDILTSIADVYPDTMKMNAVQRQLCRRLNGFTSKNDFLNARHHIRVQRGQRNKFKRGLEISGRYMAFLKKIFKEHGLPEELTALPHVESSFNYKAYSSAGAAGIWQFTRGTGKQFLKISYEVDERLDPILATEAAAKLLKRNYDALGTWPLAITAYNHGAYGMKRAVRRMKTKKLNAIIKGYRSRYFKFASRNFYCEFVAALHVMQNYETYFGKINFENPIKFKEFPLARYIKYESLSKYLNVNDDLFRKYNPALRLSIYNNSKYVPKGYRVRLPADLSPDSLLAAIPETEYYAKQKRSKYYRIRYGDNLSAIARRFGTNVSTLMSINNISNAHYIRRGMTIRLPDKTDAPVFAAIEKNEQKTVVKTEKFKPENKPEEIKPTGQLASRDADVITITTPIQIEPDDPPLSPALWYPELPDSSIANVDEGIASVMPNTISMADLEIEFLHEQPSVGFISVEPEETLGHYADWLQIRTQTIRNWNKLAYGTPLQLNQKIKLVFTTVDADDFSRKRLEYHRGIEEDFFMNYEITDTTTHVIRNGDNIWYLCNYVYNLPYWLIVDYNKDVDFNNLRAGDELVIPSVKIKSLSYRDEAD